ncbi:kinase-like protein [Westerdykella ornata]|uniref:Kinase-like protein n=1 Tax=Westerdykella ornata TaxID=318751 RepID=A0A6A6JMD3_WESOR|nr:kinase-like protein [Westerdykella ornata]KAF2277751.1 kinase-like protein [Westerdykella ornata]
MEGPESPPSKGPLPQPSSASGTLPAAPDDPRPTPHADDIHSHPNSALVNAASDHLNAQLPSLDTQGMTIPTHTFRAHIRTPTAAGLSPLQTDLPSANPPTQDSHKQDNIEGGNTGSSPHHSVTAPVAVQGGYLRTALSAASMTGSLSPASALSSPALNALTDLTPLPSPLVEKDSVGSWARGGAIMRPRSRGTSNASAKDDPFAMIGRGTLSPSPSLKRKGYQRLHTPAVEGAAAILHKAQVNEAHREKSRSVSELVPDVLHNARPRHVTISSGAPQQIGTETGLESHMHREAYLAAQRGLVSSGLPTPPASNASVKSVTESESEDIADEDKIDYLIVRQGSQTKYWRPVRKLGQGTFSKVYLATSQKLPANDRLDESTLDPRKLVAIKVVEHGPAGGADEERVELSLKREVEMLRSLSHPSLIHLKAFDHGDKRALMVLKYCPGGDLFDVASSHGTHLRPNIVQRIFAELVSAVRYLHNNLIVHRDIKLENALLNIPVSQLAHLTRPLSHPYALVTLTDLGLSRRIPAPPESPLLTTRCGSEDYAAPEILLGQAYDGRATDAWALGVLLYAFMEGRLPFDPPPGKPARSRAAHRIARCDWVWCKFGDVDGAWDSERGKGWEGARECVEGLLKKVSRGRMSLKDVEGLEWVRKGIQVEGRYRRVDDDDDEKEEEEEEEKEEKEVAEGER